MVKRMIQSFVLATFMGACLYFAHDDKESAHTNDLVVEEIIRVETPEVVKLNIDMVSASSDADANLQGSEPVEDAFEPELTYYVDVVDNYISEDSLESICAFVGDIYDISPELLQALAWTESGYNVTATGSCGDKGLCQIVSKWHYDRMNRLGVVDIYDPYGNVLVCADIISELESGKYGYDVRYVLMAYNMGPSNAAWNFNAGYISDYAIKVLRKAEELGYCY